MLSFLLTITSLLTLGLSAVQQQQQPCAECAYLPPAETTPLSQDEIDTLRHMREEEKVAGDVYAFFYDLYGLPVFSNISAAEQKHAESVLFLMERYGVADTAAGNPAGVFDDPALQALYDELTAAGSESLAAALYAGATVEELDIIDLQQAIAATSHDDIAMVYGNLLRGSGSHLRAYTSQWARVTGESYTPQYLSADDYTGLIGDGSPGNGNGWGGGNAGGRGQGNGSGQGAGSGYGRGPGSGSGWGNGNGRGFGQP